MHTPEDDTINPSSPMMMLRKNAMQHALEESERYKSKIFEFEKTFGQANADTKKEAIISEDTIVFIFVLNYYLSIYRPFPWISKCCLSSLPTCSTTNT
eukprot:scaffold709029_cov63-Attheya_sp.AAC.3